MEKKKAILIAVIAGLFLVIVVGFPMILLSSKDKAASPTVATGIPQPSASLPQQPASMDINDLVNKTTVPTPTIPAQNVIINNYDSKLDTTDSNTVKNPDGTITINVLPAPIVPPQTAPAQPAPQAEQSPPSQKPSVTPQPKPADTVKPEPKSPPAKPADTSKPAGKAADTAKPATKPAVTPKPAEKPAAPPKKKPASTQTADVDYWVQAGFFSTQVIADNAKAALATQGITAIIQNASVNGKNGFRVRIGPYTSNDEANYWLKLIKAMDGFNQSYISQTKR
jgi:DedD protein